MIDCINKCKKQEYECFITNPCFEFWLLLHFSDIKEEYADKLELIKQNKKESVKHTYISKELSDKLGHSKKNINFEKNYLPNIDKAIEHSKKFECSVEKLVDNIGTNLADLIEIIKGKS